MRCQVPRKHQRLADWSIAVASAVFGLAWNWWDFVYPAFVIALSLPLILPFLGVAYIAFVWSSRPRDRG